MENMVGVKPGNWFMDMRENCYCVVRSVTPVLTVERFKHGVYATIIENLAPVPISADNLSAAQFKNDGDRYVRLTTNQHSFTVLQSDVSAYKIYFKGNYIAPVYSVHDLQNVYEMFTDEILSINLFGI